MDKLGRKRDDHGHVIGNDEQDGQKCQHGAGGNSKPSIDYNEIERRKNAPENQKQEFLTNPKDIAANLREKGGELLGFDDDYEEEFNEDRAEKISTDIGEYFNENQLNELKKYCDRYEVDFDVAKTELAKRFDSMQKDSGLSPKDAADDALDTLTEDIVMGYNPSNEYDEEMSNAQLKNAIMSADDDVLDEQFGKDTPERKLAGAMKEKPQKSGYYTDNPIGEMTSKEYPELTGEKILHEGFKRAIPPEKISNALVKALGVSKEEADAYVKENTISANDPGWMDFDKWLKDNDLGKPEDFSKLKAKMPNGKEMSLFDFAHNITNYLDTDTASAIIAARFGVSENDAKAYLESPYNKEGSKEDYERKLNESNKKQKYKQINGQIYPVDADGKIDRNNKFPDLKSFKDVYGENVEEDK